MRETMVTVVCLIVLLFAVTIPAAAKMEGWQYQREITIRENSGNTLTDYKVFIELTGDDFPSKAKSDGADIRVTDTEGNELSYWVEEWHSGTKEAKIWVKVPSIPANGEAEITIWYGNPNAGVVSDGGATFEFFDEFDGTSLDEARWHINYGSPSVSGGVLSLNGDCIISEKVEAFGYNYIFESLSKMSDTGNEPRSFLRSTNDYTATDGQDRFEFGGWMIVDEMHLQSHNGDILTTVTTAEKFPTSFEVLGIARTATKLEAFREYVLKLTNSEEIPDDPLYLQLYSWGGETYLINWVRVRGYTSPEPTVTISEECLTTTPTPTHVPLPSSSLWVDRGGAHMEVARYQDALEAYEKAIELDPNNADAWSGKGNALGDLRRYQESLDAYEKAIELDPNNVGTWCGKGWMLDCLGRRKEATAVAQKVIDICDELIAANASAYHDDNPWHYKASELCFLGKYEDALIASNKALEIDPDNPHTWHVKGSALFELGRYQEAVDAYDKAIELNQKLPHFWINKGDALHALGKYEEADEAYAKAFAMTAPDPDPTPPPPHLPPIGPIYIICAAVIVIILIAGIGMSRKRKAGNRKITKPQPPPKSPKPETESPGREPISEPVPTEPGSNIKIASAFGYKGATIIHKIKVENPTSEPVSDIKIHLFVPEVFLLQEPDKNIGLLKPYESKTVTFEIRPTGECGDCEVSGRVTYYDYASKKTKEEDIPIKTLSIVCPLLKFKKIDEDMWRSVVSELAKAEENTEEIDMPADAIFEVTSDILKDMNMFMLPPHVNKTPQLYRATSRFYAEGVKGLKYAAQIEVVGGAKKSKLILKAWAEKEEALTGFYHGILDEIEKRVHIKSYIEDSIVQQFYHIGDKIGTVVKDSVVQRSTIGADAGNKCPSCGWDVSKEERFCSNCGAELR